MSFELYFLYIFSGLHQRTVQEEEKKPLLEGQQAASSPQPQNQLVNENGEKLMNVKNQFH